MEGSTKSMRRRTPSRLMQTYVFALEAEALWTAGLMCVCVCVAGWGERALDSGGRGAGGGGGREGCPPTYGGARQLRPYLDQYGSTSQVRRREHKDCADVTPGTDDRTSTQHQLPAAASHNQARTHTVHNNSQELFQRGGI